MSASASRPTPPDLRPEAFDEGLRGTRFAGRVVTFASVDSTIDECRRQADLGAPEGAVIVADEQRRGRGQRGRGWHSPRGLALYLSTLIRPPLPPQRAGEIVHLAGLAVLQAVRDQGVQGLVLKAPNDLLLRSPDGALRKLGGVLVDTAVQGEELRHAILSLGLNVHQREQDFPAALRPWAVSLEAQEGRRFSRPALAVAVLRRLEATCAALEEGREAALLSEWSSEVEAVQEFTPPEWPAEEER